MFVPETAPGDVVRVRVTRRKPRFLEAEKIVLLKSGPSRRVPPCPVAERCGGCVWQHLEYTEQIRQKDKILRDSLRSLKGFEWLDFLKAPNEWSYRNRIQLHVQGEQVGFFARGSRELVTFDRCAISEEAINQKLKALKPEELIGQRRIELALTEDGQLRVMQGTRDPEAALFSQVNSAQNEILKVRILDLVVTTPDWIMDLYCGAGNLSLPLAKHFPKSTVLAVELSAASIARARLNSADIDWQVGDVAQVLKKRKPQSGKGLIVLDPPRAGCDSEVIVELVRQQPKQIIYVSCNPSTFARDAERLKPQYRLVSVQGLDMFPQTEHVELIAVFEPLT